MKKIRMIAIFLLLLLYLNISDVYAYTIETLDKSTDLQEISNKEHEILNWTEGFFENENRKTDYEIDYSRAVKIYVDTNRI